MHLGNDIRYAFRQMHRSPGFAITAIFTLAVGIGATTALRDHTQGFQGTLACVAGRVLSGQLFGVGSFDLPVVVIAALAALLPARRAASIEPMQALRSE